MEMTEIDGVFSRSQARVIRTGKPHFIKVNDRWLVFVHIGSGIVGIDHRPRSLRTKSARGNPFHVPVSKGDARRFWKNKQLDEMEAK